MSLQITNVTMEALALELQGIKDRPVVDETGLKGRFNFNLKWAREEAPNDNEDNALPGFFTAIQEQTGLKLEPSKGPVDVMVVEKVELPSMN